MNIYTMTYTSNPWMTLSYVCLDVPQAIWTPSPTCFLSQELTRGHLVPFFAATDWSKTLVGYNIFKEILNSHYFMI